MLIRNQLNCDFNYNQLEKIRLQIYTYTNFLELHFNLYLLSKEEKPLGHQCLIKTEDKLKTPSPRLTLIASRSEDSWSRES